MGRQIKKIKPPLNEFFDKVYVINLAKDKVRLANFKLEAERTGIKATRVAAISGKDKRVIFNGTETEGWNKNAAALALTTLNIVKKAKEKGYKRIFIFEDDAYMVYVNFQSLFRTTQKSLMNKSKGNWDFLHLNTFDELPSEWIASCLKKLGGAWCCQAYGINEDVYDEYIEKLEKFDKPIDQMTMELHRDRNKSYSSDPHLVYHKSNRPSSLREKIVHY
jgi:GR25 family glycosyltransferase involved in LPS biosynthesis